MANSNFIVHNGLQVGPLTIFASNGSISTTGSLSALGTLTSLDVSGDATITGNLTVSGSLANVATTNSVVSDSLIGLNEGATSNSSDLGIVMERGSTGDNAFMGWDESLDRFIVGTTTATASSTGDLTITAANIQVSYVIGTSSQALYADLAENYLADLNYEPGTVLAFGGPKEVTIAGEDTTRVAGIVSTNPAHLMNGALKGSDVVALALQGRVPCRVIGPVRKGDMMVAAGHGYAKASATPKLGSIIGKALEDFDRDKGVIEIVVGRL